MDFIQVFIFNLTKCEMYEYIYLYAHMGGVGAYMEPAWPRGDAPGQSLNEAFLQLAFHRFAFNLFNQLIF